MLPQILSRSDKDRLFEKFEAVLGMVRSATLIRKTIWLHGETEQIEFWRCPIGDAEIAFKLYKPTETMFLSICAAGQTFLQRYPAINPLLAAVKEAGAVEESEEVYRMRITSVVRSFEMELATFLED